MKPIYTMRIPVDEALDYQLHKESLSWALVDRAWEEASANVPGFKQLDDAGDVGETSVELDGTDFVVTVHDLREED